MKRILIVIFALLTAFSCTGQKQHLIDKADAYYNKGIDLILSGASDNIAFLHFDSALMYYERPEYYLMRGSSNATLGEYSQAISDYEKAVEMASLGKSGLSAMRELVLVNTETDNYPRAIYYSLKLNRIKPLSIPLSDIGITYYQMGDYENAYHTIEEAIKSQTAGQPVELFGLLGDCALRLGFKEQAISFLHAADSMGSTFAAHVLDSLKKNNHIKR